MEPDVWKQVNNLAAVPGVERIAIMPDAHIGNGACVGSAILTRDIVIPAAVGVDIGCGMIAAPLGLRRSDVSNLAHLRARIEERIPVGRTNRGQKGDRGAWGTVPKSVRAVWSTTLEREYLSITRKRQDLDHPSVLNHLGTLGTGNHFLEVCIELDSDSEDPPLWLMLHSGSRGVGNKIGQWFTRRARAECEKAGVKLPDPELGFLTRGTPLFDEYLRAARWAQDYAWQNRMLMFRHAIEAIATALARKTIAFDEDRLVHCHHNYVAVEEHFGKAGLLTRKGAVNAADGVMGIIPGSMGAKSYITRGKGNPEALCTSSHGAGRVLSRGAARRSITLEQHLKAIEGVECRTDPDVIDESPACYKPIDAVMAAQAELTEPVVALKQIVVVKG